MYFVSSANAPSWEPTAILNVALIIKVGQVERSRAVGVRTWIGRYSVEYPFSLTEIHDF